MTNVKQFIFSSIFETCRKPGDSSGARQIRNTPDWSENAVSGDHLWVATSVSGDCCYIGDNDCTVSASFIFSYISKKLSLIYRRL